MNNDKYKSYTDAVPFFKDIEAYLEWKEAQGRPNYSSPTRLGMFRDKGDLGANPYEGKLFPKLIQTGVMSRDGTVEQEGLTHWDILDYNREHDINAILQRMEEDSMGRTLLMELLNSPHANIDSLISENENKPKADEWSMSKYRSPIDLVSRFLNKSK